MRKPFNGNYPITQSFGERPEYYRQFGLAGHEGIDYGCPIGTEILVVADGKVVRRAFSPKDYGNFVVIWHPQLKIASWYCHLQEAKVSFDQEVKEGEVIGLSGNTGNTTGAHLHFGICQVDENGYRINKNNGYQGFVDPAPYLNAPDPLQECLRLHKIAVDSANKKDEIIKDLQEQIENLKKADEDRRKQLDAVYQEKEKLAKEVSTLNESLITAEKKYQLLQNEMETALAKARLDQQDKLKDQETRMTKDFEIKEQQFKKQIEELEEKLKQKQVVIEKEKPHPKSFREWLIRILELFPKNENR